MLFEAVSLAQLKGPFVAYAWTATALDSSASGVTVINIRSGKVHRRAAALFDAHLSAWQEVSALELKADGDFGWIGQGRGVGAPDGSIVQREVSLSEPGGSRPLEIGLQIAPRSLNLRGSILSWMASGTTHSETLR
ncbi:MAG: hypothetical protein ACOYD4_05380 [Solirubrobacterales bacterium]